MAVKLNVHWDDGTIVAAPGTTVAFSPSFEARLVRSGLAEAETLNEARERIGMDVLPDDDLETLREKYREIIGRSPFNRWNADELRRRIDEAEG